MREGMQFRRLTGIAAGGGAMVCAEHSLRSCPRRSFVGSAAAERYPSARPELAP